MANRVIKDSIKRSAQVDSLTWFEEVVFLHMIVTADDHGCLDGRAVVLKNELFPTKENVTKRAIEEAVAKLVSVGLLCEYTVSGMPYLFFPTWEKHQRIRNQRRKYPAPPENAIFENLSATRGELPQVAANCGLNPIQSESNPNPNPIQSGADGDDAVRLLFQTWEKAAAKLPSGLQAEKLQALAEDFGVNAVVAAIKTAAEYNAVNIAYVRKVLLNKDKPKKGAPAKKHDEAVYDKYGFDNWG